VTSEVEPQPIRRILVVGGGTAGWIAAGVLASRYPRRGEDGISVTLIESLQQPPIGVGEGTWPTIRAAIDKLREGVIGRVTFARCFQSGLRPSIGR